MLKKLLFVVILSVGYTTYAQQYSSVGNGTPYFTYSLYVYGNKLYVGSAHTGYVTSLNEFLGTWDGSQWDSMPSSVYVGDVYSMTTYNNNLIAAGGFLSANGLPNTITIAGWNDTNWFALGSGGIGIASQLYSVITYNGSLYVGGRFGQIGGISAYFIARWDGSTWHPLSTGVSGSVPRVKCLAVYNGELYAGGIFYDAGGVAVNNIAKWNGTQWSAVGTGLSDYIISLTVDTINNVLYAGGAFVYADTIQVNHIAKWNGTNWSALANGVSNSVTSSTMYHGELYAGISSTTITGSVTDTVLAKWNGSQWIPFTPGPNGPIEAMQVYHDTLYLGGAFNKVGADSISCIVKFYNTPVGLQEEESTIGQDEIIMFPNPATDELEVRSSEFGDKVEIKIVDVLGRIIYTAKLLSPNTELNTANFLKGLYFVQLTTDTHKTVKKLVIE